MGEQHHSLLPVGLYVRHHLAHPLLRAFLVAESHAALVILEVIVPQAIYRPQMHGACTIVADSVGMDVVTAVVGHYTCGFVFRVEDDGLAYW